ncbi:aminopeptidase P family protein [Winogradskyella sp.]|jgi:Xaa-Pro aminopeptidase|uniref:aminopeptidase P family protein n=1 Tax=Winogradskyella sp. TaxID=1883156 RepID=UPI0025E87FC3|nr:aminopeptidase P family protein [Winogradskyella sp.]MCT4629845.1 aminopeptidase P family protein [Winogradskyella sp.]
MIAERLVALRAQMKTQNVDAFIIPSTDPHQSEYVSGHWKLREYFSGFTGSAGTLVITQDIAALWTDSRYFLQFEDECANTEVQLCKQTIPHAPEHVKWLCDLLPEGTTIGVNYFQFSKSQIDLINTHAKAKHIQVKNQPDFADAVWTNRPSLPNETIDTHPLEFSGETTASKLKKVKHTISTQKANYYLFSALDEIAWLFNIRSRDVDFTPLVTAYALVGIDKTLLFCKKERLSSTAIEAFSKLNVEIIDYDKMVSEMERVASESVIITDPSSLNYATYNATKATFIYQKSLVKKLKAIKNETEIEGAINCMHKDGVALTKFFIWLENELEKREISEYEIGRKLNSFRAQQEYYTGESFAAIVGYKGNGAIIHYTAAKEGSAMVKNEGILLIDSGAQYRNGTTDITRTIWLGGTPSKTIKTAYTSVLKGYIQLETQQFPQGTTGTQLDTLARMHMWNSGLNYPHGTGHGIGSFGMVHEPAQGFATSGTTERGTTPHLPNQFTTIEPGCYVTNEFGIRTENVVVSKAIKTTPFGTFLGFTPITLCYIDTQLVSEELLTSTEKTWLNNYNEMVFNKLKPQLNDNEQKWLANKCKSI